jgi:hypothetical protein
LNIISIMSLGVVEDEEDAEDPGSDGGAVMVTTELSGYLIVVVFEPSGLVLAEVVAPGPKISARVENGAVAGTVPEGAVEEVPGLDGGDVAVVLVEG